MTGPFIIAYIRVMSSRSGAVHVAITERRYKGKLYRTHLLRRTFRENGKVKHETLGNLSHLPDHVIDLVRRSLKGESFVNAQAAFEVIRSLPHGHVAAVLGSVRKLELHTLIASKRCRERQLVEAMVVARVIDPSSKLATARALNEPTAVSSLGECLELGRVNEDELYEAMDWLLPRQARIEKELARRHLSEGSLVLYDVTSTYFEGRHCPLGKLGYSRDGKTGKLQIVWGLLCNAEGCPVAVEVFEGNTADPKTLATQVEKIQKRFSLKRIVLVGDRGLVTNARIREELKPSQTIDWITALRAPSIRQLERHGSLQMSLFDERDLAEVRDAAFPDERLIVCRNPLLAEERARKRQELLDATEQELKRVEAATKRAKRPLRGKEKIGVRVGRVLGRFKMGKHFQWGITEDSFQYKRDQDNIDQEAMLDGVYVIRTNVAAEHLSAEQAVRSYKQLSVVERAFRCMKGVDLKVRPLFHRLAERVRAHVLLCMLAYYVEWHMRRALSPILFEDDDKAAAEKKRASVVAPAQRSDNALRKAATKQTTEGIPVQSFHSSLKDLATVVKNRVRTKGTERGSFEIVTTPSSLQKRAFELLGVNWL